MSDLEQETSTSLKEFLIGDNIKAFITGTVLGFSIAYGLLKFCPKIRDFCNFIPNLEHVNVNKD